MLRTGSLRPLVGVFCLFVCLFGFGVNDALATHYRYATLTWEKDLNHSVPGEIKVKVTVKTGMRWSFPFGTPAGQPIPTNACPGQGGIPQTTPPFVATNGVGAGSCPPVGRVIQLAGQLQFANTANTNIFVKINGATTTTNGINHDATVTEINPELDIVYTTFSADVVFTLAQNPIKAYWTSNARISTLLEGNADNSWRVEATINGLPPNTKSPVATSFPMIFVTQNQVNTIQLPSITFDNTTPRWRISTTAESSLSRPVPGSLLSPAGQLTLNPINQGQLTFTPSAAGPYAAQFMVTAYDANGIAGNAVPLDLIFVSGPAVPGLTATLDVNPPDLTKVFPVNQSSSFTVSASLQPPNSAYSVTINKTPLPGQPASGPGAAAFTPSGPCTGGAVCTGTFSWTPNLLSTGNVVCFQAIYTQGSNFVQSQQKCVTINLAALATTLVAFPASGAASGPVKLMARLTRTVDGAPLPQRDITFTVPQGASTLTVTAPTNASGYAVVSPVIPKRIDPPQPYGASFTAVANEFLQSSAASNAIVVKAATTSIDLPPAVPPVVGDPLPSLGFPIVASAILNRHFTDGGAFGVGQDGMVFTLSPPSGAPIVVPGGNTSASGVSVANFPVPTALGSYNISANFAGNDNLIGPAQSPTRTFQVYQRTQLTLAPVNAPITATVHLRATLVEYPLDTPQPTPIANALVTFTWGGVPVNTVTAFTDVDGVADVPTTFAVPGIVNVTAKYTPGPAYLNRSGLKADEISLAAATITPPTATQFILTPLTVISGQTGHATAHLQTTGAPPAPVPNATVSFSVVNGGPLGTGTTDASGDVIVNFTAGDGFSGDYQASFAAIPGYAATSATAAYNVNKAVTTLSAISVPAIDLVGDVVTVSTQLARFDAPSGLVSGAPIVFTLTGLAANPDGATTTTVNATTDASGFAAASFTLTRRGTFTFTASYAGSDTLKPTSRFSTLTVYQQTWVVVNAAQGVAGALTSVSAKLTTDPPPGNAALSGRIVNFSFAGGAADGNAITDTNGVATLITTFPNAGLFTVTASFIDLASFFVDGTGVQQATTSTANVNIIKADTAMDPLTLDTTQFVGDASPVVTTLTRVTTPSGGVVNAPVVFTLTGSGSPVTQTVATGVGGAVHATFTPTQKGPFTVTATFAGNGALNSSSASESITVYQKTTLTAAPATGLATQPITVSASLNTAPGGAAVEGQLVSFSFSGGPGGPGAPLPDPVTGTTDASGLATASVTFAKRGTYTVHASFINVADYFANAVGALAATTGSATVEVINTPPTFDAPADRVEEATKPQGADITLTLFGDDAEDGQLTATCVPAGPTFAIGSTYITCTVTDGGGLEAIDSFTITVVDTTAPVVTAPANQSAESTSSAGAIVAYTGESATDAVGVVSLSCALASGSVFAIGTTTVTCTATDAANNSGSATFTVTVGDTTPPVVTAPANLAAVEAAFSNGAFVTYTGESATDAVGVVSLECLPASGSVFAIGLSTVTCTATDAANNSGSASFTVTVVDTVAPLVTAPLNPAAVEAVDSNGAVVTYTGEHATDAVGLATLGCAPASGSVFAIGYTTVTCTATDAANNSGYAFFIVTVVDTTAPVVTAPSNTNTEASSSAGATVTYTGELATDAVGVVNLACAPASGSQFPIGSSTVTCTATDAANNSGSASFIVTVVDTTAPAVTAPANKSAEATSNLGAIVGYTGESATDAVGVTNLACLPASGSQFAIGSTTVTCTATDAATNSGSATFTVTVHDTTAPVVTAPANKTSEASSNLGAIVAYSGESATDAVGVTNLVCVPASGSQFAIGSSIVTCTAVDAASNSGSATFTVTVHDTTAPVVTAPANKVAEATAPLGAFVNYSGQSATDAVGVTNLACAPVSGSQFAIGSTTVTCTATDAATNSGSASFTVTVNDTTPPALTLPAPVVQHAVNGAGKVITYTATAADIVDLSTSVTCAPASGSTFPIGATTVNCSTSDSRSNSSSNSFTVTITNATPVAVANAYTTNANTPITVAAATGVLANDSDADGDLMTALQVSGVSHGALTLNADGSFSYSPAFDYAGPDSFSYKPYDQRQNGNTVTVSFTVQTPEQVAAQTTAIVTAIDPGLANDVLKILNKQQSCMEAAKLTDKITKDNKYTAAQKATMIAAVASLAQSMGCQ